ncbi:hypothetical protein [Sulfuritalea sp.]|uniref:hypothetical protein n=1 Tax=Sulfuritalea sp. TaxID=2480090 RepID=UPI00286E95C4|nr:hypothetical protein [Sulfuritalea sp.]
MRTLLKVFYRLFASLLIAGCAGLGAGGNDLHWTEEVKLSDGRIIQVQRKTEIAKHAGFPANRRGLYKSHEICYAPMNLRWKSVGGYRPDIFDIVDGKAYMHVPIAGCEECRLHGFPATGAHYFLWEGGQWKRIRHEEFPVASEWNLLWDSQSAHEEDDVRGFLSLANKLKDRDQSMRHEQRRIGWKRFNESYSYKRNSCDKCDRVNPSPEVAPETFINDGSNSCQQ